MSKATEPPGTPRAMIHRRILDVARANPETPVDDLAPMVSGATPDLVRRVFDEYGDPAADEASGATTQAGSESEEPATSQDPPTADPAPVEDGSPSEQASTEQGDAPPSASATGQADSTGEDTMSKSDAVTNGSPESATEHAAGASAPEDASQSDATTTLNQRQLETLRAIREHPDASQRKLADVMDVSHSTISHRLNKIPGFDWENRWEFVTERFCDAESDPDPARTADGVEDRLDHLEHRVDALDGSEAGVLDDPELAHKIVHACMDSDKITEDEELRILRTALDDGPIL